MNFVSIIMGSKSDYEIMKNCSDTFEKFIRLLSVSVVLTDFPTLLLHADNNKISRQHHKKFFLIILQVDYFIPDCNAIPSIRFFCATKNITTTGKADIKAAAIKFPGSKP